MADKTEAEIYAEARPGIGGDILAGRLLAIERTVGGRLIVVAGNGLIVARVLQPDETVLAALRGGRRYLGHVERIRGGTVLVLRVAEAAPMAGGTASPPTVYWSPALPNHWVVDVAGELMMVAGNPRGWAGRTPYLGPREALHPVTPSTAAVAALRLVGYPLP